MGCNPSYPGPHRKCTDYAKIISHLPQLFPVMLPYKKRKCCHSAAEIADTHRAGIGVTTHLAECLYLHGTGKRYKDRSGHIIALGNQSHESQNYDLCQQNPLPPMNPLRIAKTVLYVFRQKNTQSKGHKWQQITNSFLPPSFHKMLAHQHHISGLCIGENLIPAVISIGILKSSG